MERKRISVSAKRQITIPQKFYEKLNMGSEVECILRNGEIVIRPVRNEDELVEEILKDLIAKGFNGPQLIDEYKRVRAQVRPAVEKMLDEADEAAQNVQGSGDDVMEELFGSDEPDGTED